MGLVIFAMDQEIVHYCLIGALFFCFFVSFCASLLSNLFSPWKMDAGVQIVQQEGLQPTHLSSTGRHVLVRDDSIWQGGHLRTTN